MVSIYLRLKIRSRFADSKSLFAVCAGDVALKEGVIRIVRTFGGKLSAFKFPMGTARKLQGFVDYCA